MGGDDPGAVEDLDAVGAEPDLDATADVADRNRVEALADTPATSHPPAV